MLCSWLNGNPLKERKISKLKRCHWTYMIMNLISASPVVIHTCYPQIDCIIKLSFQCSSLPSFDIKVVMFEPLRGLRIWNESLQILSCIVCLVYLEYTLVGISKTCLLLLPISTCLLNCFVGCLLILPGPRIEKSFCMQMHRKGSRHQAAESRFKEGESRRQDEIRKRIALSDGSIGSAETSTSAGQFRSARNPLIEQTKKAASEILCNKVPKQNATTQRCNAKETRDDSSNRPSNDNDNSFFPAMEAGGRAVAKLQSDFQSIRERELRFTAAGWKRDCHGKWFKDENVCFFSFPF